MFRAPGDAGSTTWLALALDGLKFQTTALLSEENGCCIDNPIKILLLRKLYKSNYAGGIIKSNEEEWQYNSDGSLNCLVGSKKIHYTWTGEFLQPSLGSDIFNFGTGKWDGVNLFWFPATSPSATNSVKNTIGRLYYGRKPFRHYVYSEKENEYLTKDSENEWKWTRHFLASKSGEPEWIIEGDVPKPVVMLLQMMRYYIKTTTHMNITRIQNISSDDVNISPTIILRARTSVGHVKRRKSYEVSSRLKRKTQSRKFMEPI